MTLNITDGSTTPKPNGVDFLDEYAGHIATLYETGARPLTVIGGTPDVVTATMVVDLTPAGYVDGLMVSLVWAADNTSNVTLAINGGANVPVVDAAGDALAAGAITTGLCSLLRYTAGSWRIISSVGGGGGAGAKYYLAITASTTWNKPSGFDPDAMVIIEAWAGGGGANGAGRGGGGGAYARREMRYADVPSSVTVTIGAGGASGVRGGNTTFGSLLTAYNGGAGGALAGGGGGGELSQGGNVSGSTPGAGGGIGGGAGGTAGGVAAGTLWGGGGGGSPTGGDAVYGGGGGGTTTAGVSKFGGNGGTTGVAGTAPGGGGGQNAAGARGEIRIWIQ